MADMVLVFVIVFLIFSRIIIVSDTLNLVTEDYIAKYKFSRDGTSLILNFISSERKSEIRGFPVRLEGAWSPNY